MTEQQNDQPAGDAVPGDDSSVQGGGEPQTPADGGQAAAQTVTVPADQVSTPDQPVDVQGNPAAVGNVSHEGVQGEGAEQNPVGHQGISPEDAGETGGQG